LRGGSGSGGGLVCGGWSEWLVWQDTKTLSPPLQLAHLTTTFRHHQPSANLLAEQAICSPFYHTLWAACR